MMGYLIAGGAGIALGTAAYFYERKLIKEHEKAYEENKRAYEKLMFTLNDTEKKEEVSKLVTCLNNYLNLRIQSEP